MTDLPLTDQIAAVNAYADFIEQLGPKAFPARDRAALTMGRAAYAIIAATETWTVLDESDPRNMRLQAPDGTVVLLTCHLYGNKNGSVERLTILAKEGD